MATMQDIIKLRQDHTLDLRDERASYCIRLVGALDLRGDPPIPDENFYETMPVHAVEPYSVSKNRIASNLNTSKHEAYKARFLIIVSVVAAIVGLGLLMAVVGIKIAAIV